MTGNCPRCTPTRDLHTALKIPYVRDFITKLCRQQAEVIKNRNTNVRNAGKGKVLHKKRKSLNLGWRRSHLRALHWLNCLQAEVKYGIISKISGHWRKHGLRRSFVWDVTLRRWVIGTRRFESTAMSLNAGNRGTVARRYIAKTRNLKYTAVNTSKLAKQGLEWQMPCMYCNSVLLYVFNNAYAYRLPTDIKTCTTDKHSDWQRTGLRSRRRGRPEDWMTFVFNKLTKIW